MGNTESCGWTFKANDINMSAVTNTEQYAGKTIVFCLPGKQFTNNFLMSWNDLFFWCLSNGINPIVVNKYSPNAYYTRNLCLGGNTLAGVNQTPFGGKIKYDYIMWIDSDSVFTPKSFIELLKVNQPIVSGLCMMQNGTQYAVVEKMDNDYYRRKGEYQFLTKHDISKKAEPFKVDYVGFAWMLIKYGVFEQLSYPWFRPLWFDFSTKTNKIEEFCTEDLAFCQRVKEIGHSIWVTPTSIIGHEKNIII